MDINLKVTLTNGIEVKYTSSDFPTLGACQEQILRLIGQETGSLTINLPDGSRTVLPARHIAAVRFAPAGDR